MSMALNLILFVFFTRRPTRIEMRKKTMRLGIILSYLSLTVEKTSPQSDIDLPRATCHEARYAGKPFFDDLLLKKEEGVNRGKTGHNFPLVY